MRRLLLAKKQKVHLKKRLMKSKQPVSLLDHAHLAGPHYKLADGRCVAAGVAYRG